MQGREKITIASLRKRKSTGERFAVLTCYDYSTARLMEEAGMDAILVGDTYGEVCLGHNTTLGVKLDHLIAVTDAVRRGAPSALLIGDMPYLSYQINNDEAIRNAGRFMAEAGCDCVKLEVDRRLADVVAAMSRATIPVIAHLGLLPQSIHKFGGYKSQGKTAQGAQSLIEDAKIMEEAGACALLLEAVPAEVSGIITRRTELPVIGCISGPYCDGQVVVMHDMLGFQAGHPPKSVNRYANLHDILVDAFTSYAGDVRQGTFPSLQQSVRIPEKEMADLEDRLRRAAHETR